MEWSVDCRKCKHKEVNKWEGGLSKTKEFSRQEGAEQTKAKREKKNSSVWHMQRYAVGGN